MSPRIRWRCAPILLWSVIISGTLCLAITFQNSTVIFINELRWWIISSRKVWTSILEFTVQIVQLEHQKVVLLIIKVLCGFQIDGYIILNRHIEDIIQIMHDFLSVLRVLKYHSKIWKKFFATSISIGRTIQEQYASKIHAGLEILIYFLSLVAYRFPSREIRKTFIYPLDYLGQQQYHIMHCKYIKNSPEKHPNFIVMSFIPFEYLIGSGYITRGRSLLVYNRESSLDIVQALLFCACFRVDSREIQVGLMKFQDVAKQDAGFQLIYDVFQSEIIFTDVQSVDPSDEQVLLQSIQLILFEF